MEVTVRFLPNQASPDLRYGITSDRHIGETLLQNAAAVPFSNHSVDDVIAPVADLFGVRDAESVLELLELAELGVHSQTDSKGICVCTTNNLERVSLPECCSSTVYQPLSG